MYLEWNFNIRLQITVLCKSPSATTSQIILEDCTATTSKPIKAFVYLLNTKFSHVCLLQKMLFATQKSAFFSFRFWNELVLFFILNHLPLKHTHKPEAVLVQKYDSRNNDQPTEWVSDWWRALSYWCDSKLFHGVLTPKRWNPTRRERVGFSLCIAYNLSSSIKITILITCSKFKKSTFSHFAFWVSELKLQLDQPI